ncbi:unnamed protein product [Malus baccata var. baccata]
MAADNRTIKELLASGLANAAPLCIQYPAAAQGKTDEFELKSSLLHHIPKYHGLSMEDPNKHLKEFEVVCSSMTPINVDESILKMKAFPFSLLEKAKDWLYELAPGIVTSWESMKRAFLEKFFPTSKVILLRKRVSGIEQGQGESFPAYYERFKALVASCPPHQMKEELLIQYFYEGLLPLERQMLDASVGWALVDKTPVAAKTLIAYRALNAQQYEGLGLRDFPRHQVNEVSSTFDIQSQLANLTSIVSQMAEGMKIQGQSICGVCSMQGHLNDQCPQLIENGGWESANAMGYQGQNQQRSDPYSNTYNPGWSDHPNFKWREPQQPQQQSQFRQPPGFLQKPFVPSQAYPQATQQTSGSSLNNTKILELLTSMSQGLQNQTKEMQLQAQVVANHQKEMGEMKNQLGQISEFLGQIREQGRLPSSTIVNPKEGFEIAKAITLRSGKELGDHSKVSNQGHQEDNKLMQEEEKDEEATTRKEKTVPQPPIAPLPCPTPKVSHNSTQSSSIPLNVPFPSRFMQTKNDEEEKDILETFRKVHVNIPLLNAIKQIPKYAKFLKKLCTTRNRIREKEVVHVSENVSTLLQRKLPPKCKDPADRSNAYPKGVLEDVLVQVDHLIFPANFYMLDMEDSVHSPSSPLLLGRPFMKTAQTKIDVAKGAVTMAFGGDMINFKVSESTENTNDVRSCCAIDVIKSKRQERSTPIKKIAFQTINKKGIGVKHKDYTATTLKPPNLAESTPHAFVDCAAASLPNIGKTPIPISIPISTNRLLPSLVQVPNRMQGGGEVYIDFWKHKAPIRRDYYPLPFIEPMYEYFEEHDVEDVSLHDVGPIQA